MFGPSSFRDSLGARREVATKRSFGAAAVLIFVGVTLLAPPPHLAAQQLRYDREYPAIEYYTRAAADPVSTLQRSLARGDAALSFTDGSGYLASLLRSLSVPLESQMLVFSKTSFQERFISPETPRALYFSDDVYVAWLQGSDFVEIAAMDPNLGPVFYTLAQTPSPTPEFRREYGLCLQCHDSYGLSGGGVPRFLIGSGATNEVGRPMSHNSWQLTTDQTPLARRWGGWYVTGTHGSQTHMGNVVFPVLEEPTTERTATNGNLTDLSALLDTAPYLTGHSDIVALMVVEHQIHVQNVMTRASWEVRNSASDTATPADVAPLAEPLVRALLFVDEAPLTGPVAGGSGFRRYFENLGVRDGQGRSLRELDLTHRLFVYPLSYLIYSDAFEALPTTLKDRVFKRIFEVTSGEDASGAFDHLRAEDRSAILDILKETHFGFGRWFAAR